MHTHIHLRTHTHMKTKTLPFALVCFRVCVCEQMDRFMDPEGRDECVSPTATKYKQYTQQLKDAIKSVRSWTHEEKRSITYESFEVFQYICLKFLTDNEINESDAALW